MYWKVSGEGSNNWRDCFPGSSHYQTSEALKVAAEETGKKILLEGAKEAAEETVKKVLQEGAKEAAEGTVKKDLQEGEKEAAEEAAKGGAVWCALII